MIRADHPRNTKRGGVYIYYNDKISVMQMSNINLPECLACEIVIGKKKVYVITFIALQVKIKVNLNIFFYL